MRRCERGLHDASHVIAGQGEGTERERDGGSEPADPQHDHADGLLHVVTVAVTALSPR
jgi:hypothetical protein